MDWLFWVQPRLALDIHFALYNIDFFNNWDCVRQEFSDVSQELFLYFLDRTYHLHEQRQTLVLQFRELLIDALQTFFKHWVGVN